MVGGAIAIESIEPGQTQQVYNGDYFVVGNAGVLDHDFTFVQPVDAPFERLPQAAELESTGRP
jgi:hypothetical protein